MNVVFIWVPKYLNFAGLSESRMPFLMLWFCAAFCSQCIDIYLVFPALISKPLSLVVSDEASLFSFSVSIISPHKFSPRSRNWYIQFHSLHFAWFFLMAYSDAKLKRIGDKQMFRIIVGKYSRKMLYLRSSGDRVACWDMIYWGFQSSRVLYLSLGKWFQLWGSISRPSWRVISVRTHYCWRWNCCASLSSQESYPQW